MIWLLLWYLLQLTKELRNFDKKLEFCRNICFKKMFTLISLCYILINANSLGSTYLSESVYFIFFWESMRNIVLSTVAIAVT